MILRKIRLKNIRSYKEATIELSEGTTLLAGDIGAGKSTILLAAEFALFGVLRGVLGGETLLRNGANEGSVTLEMEIEGKPISIHRTLKRTKQSVQQEAGSITIDGVEQQATATELKSKMLETLGYPSELLTKNKGLIYRYTVYTPQEDMKSILFEGPEVRLNTLRRVFDIDKYARIEENAKIHIRSVRERCRHNEGMITDLDSKQAQLNAKEIEIKIIAEQAAIAKKQAESARKQLAEAQAAQEAHEANIKQLHELRQKLAVRENEQRALASQRARAADELEKSKAGIAGLCAGQSIGAANGAPIDSQSINAALQSTEQNIRTIEQSIRTSTQHLGAAQANAGSCMDLSKKLASMPSCPTCKQPVTEDHKSKIAAIESERLSIHQKEIESHSIAIAQLETSKAHLRKRHDEIRSVLQGVIAAQAQEKHRKDLIERAASLIKQIQETDKKISDTNAIKSELSRLIFPLENSEHDMKKAKEAHSIAMAADKSAAAALARLAAQRESLSGHILEIKKEIAEKTAVKERLNQDKKNLNWLDEGFLKMMKLMEQQVMASVYHQFNDSFTKWFNMLIEDNLMTARLDENFTPTVTQNGYDTPIEDLSGGEKTSIALAYRLALNKVINDLHTTIKTRDLLILDEPTDGFSSEQLDRVRDVMRELPVRQCILVSHETKIESFVEKIITIEKTGHVSAVSYTSPNSYLNMVHIANTQN